MNRILFCFAMVLIACNNSEKSAETTTEKTVDTVTTGVGNDILDLDSACVAAIPSSILKKNAFPKTSFALVPEKREGIETIELENGDKITITSGGCEYYNLVFRFETSRFEGELTNVGFWYKRGVTLINELVPKLNAGIDIAKGAERIMNRIEEEVPNGYQNLAFGEDLDFEDGRSIVSIEEVQQVTAKRFAITVSFATGPL